MKREEIKQKVTESLVTILGVDESEIKESSNLRDDLGCDSLDTVELIMDMEKEFNIGVPDDHIEHITTVEQIIDYLEKTVA